MLSLACSVVNKKVRANVKACLDENRIGQGRFIKQFEDSVAAYVGAKYAIAVSNGSMADIVALAALKYQHPEKTEVIVPALTFIAHINSVILNGLTPVFVDINADLQMNEYEVAEKVNSRTLAIFPVHLLGKKCNIDQLKKIAAVVNAYVIEDSCESFGTYNNTDFATYSFFPSHTITTGEGGMLVTNNKTHADWARKIMNHGRRSDIMSEKFHFDCLGFNGKMSNVLAAIGCGVMDNVPEIIFKRQKNVELFNQLLNEHWFAESPHGYPVFYRDEEERDGVLRKLEANDIEARKIFSCIPTQEWKMGGGFYPIAESIGRRGLYVPVHQNLSENDIRKIALFL